MKFICSLIVVEDIPRARVLYEGILHQKVSVVFGEDNVAFDGGLASYRKILDQHLLGGKETASRTNTFEFIHTIKEEPRQKRVFRFYDYDGNIVVIAESMG